MKKIEFHYGQFALKQCIFVRFICIFTKGKEIQETESNYLAVDLKKKRKRLIVLIFIEIFCTDLKRISFDVSFSKEI